MALTLSEAQKRLPDLVAKARREGPQTLAVADHGAEMVISVSRSSPPTHKTDQTFKDLLRSLPSLDDVDLARDETPARAVEL